MEKITTFPSPLEVDRFLYDYIWHLQFRWLHCFRPVARWIGSFTLVLEKNIDVSIYAFPSPLEVDRWLYEDLRWFQNLERGFRPLAGWIGCSTRNMALTDTHVLGAFPAPLEVDRFLYKPANQLLTTSKTTRGFRPLSRWIGSFLIHKPKTIKAGLVVGFPSPLEVDRFLYEHAKTILASGAIFVSVPSRGR